MLKKRDGFTLIELLIVIVIIGILAAIAIPKFGKTREKAYFKAMMSDLRNLQAQQEVYYSGGAYSYTDDTRRLEFIPSKGVNIGQIEFSTTGWSVTATHDGLGNFGCAIYYGSGVTVQNTPGRNIAPQVGVVTCDDQP